MLPDVFVNTCVFNVVLGAFNLLASIPFAVTFPVVLKLDNTPTLVTFG
jgi:hypothetical protein